MQSLTRPNWFCFTTGLVQFTAAASESRVSYSQEAGDKFPYVVHIIRKAPGAYCAGTVIGPRTVLTSAYCAYWDGNYEDVSVGFGNDRSEEGTTKVIAVKKIFVPGGFSESDLFGNIAILELAEPTTVKPIAFASEGTSLAAIKSVTIPGFGSLTDNEDTTMLHYASAPTVPLDECTDMVTQSDSKPYILPPDAFCVGLGDPPVDACYDGGSPYIAYIANKPVQIGVYSHRPLDNENKHCSEPGYNLMVGNSISYWSAYIKETHSFYNLNGAKPPARLNSIYYDTCFTGKSIKKISISYTYKCTEACRALPTCKYWTHNIPSGTCTLFKSRKRSIASSKCRSGFFSNY